MNQEVRAVCPACGSITLKGRIDPKFYYNPDKQVGYCHHCGYRGKIDEETANTLDVVNVVHKSSFDSSVFQELEPLPPEAWRYLQKRFPGAEQSQLDAFQLKYSRKHHAIAIPSFTPDNQLQGIKYRLIAPTDGNRYTAQEGSQFGGYWVYGQPDKLLVVEGEFDAIAAIILGFKGTVLALQTNKLSFESLTAVKTYQNVFTCLDNDAKGQEGRDLITKQLPFSTISDVVLDGVKDLNELLMKRGIDEGHRFLQKETRTELERSTVTLSQSISELISYLSDSRNTRGDSTGWKAIDRLFGGGFRPNEMTVINAFAKTGKTSFINNLVHNLAASNKKVALASFEMDPARSLYPSLLSIAGQTNVRTLSSEKALIDSIELISKECSYLANIVTFKRFGITPWKDVEAWATLMKKQYGIEYLMLDHAGFMVEKMTDAEENQTLAKNIKKLTNTLNLHIFIVVQAPKTKDGLSIQTSYGGLAWGMNADNFLILERSKINESELQVRLEAARYPGSNPSNIPALLFYDRETCSLYE